MAEPAVESSDERTVDVSLTDLLLVLDGWGFDDPSEASSEAQERMLRRLLPIVGPELSDRYPGSLEAAT